MKWLRRKFLLEQALKSPTSQELRWHRGSQGTGSAWDGHNSAKTPTHGLLLEKATPTAFKPQPGQWIEEKHDLMKWAHYVMSQNFLDEKSQTKFKKFLSLPRKKEFSVI